MRTTLDLDDQLLKQAKVLAASERKSLTQLIEEGLALRVLQPVSSAKKAAFKLPIHHGRGGLLPAARKARSYGELLDLLDDQGAS